MPLFFPEQIEEILRRGGGLRIHTAGKMPDLIKKYATSAGAGHARLTLVVNSIVLPEDLKEIASRGQGYVAFEFHDAPDGL